MIRSIICVCQLLVYKLDPLVQIQGKAEPKIGMVNPPLALSFYFWQFCTGEWWIYCRLEQKNLEKCYRWDFFILDPKKSKKARKCDKILLYYWVHSYGFEFKRATNVNKWILCELITDHTCRFEFELVCSTAESDGNSRSREFPWESA